VCVYVLVFVSMSLCIYIQQDIYTGGHKNTHTTHTHTHTNTHTHIQEKRGSLRLDPARPFLNDGLFFDLLRDTGFFRKRTLIYICIYI
jgi:hypothetical protein